MNGLRIFSVIFLSVVILALFSSCEPTAPGGEEDQQEETEVSVDHLVASGISGIYGIFFLDVRDPLDVQLLDEVKTTEHYSSVFVENERAYVFDSKKLRIFDISNLSDVKELKKSYPLSSAPNGLFVSNGNAYIADGDSGFVIIEDVDGDGIKYTYSVQGYVRDVYVRGNYAYVGVGQSFSIPSTQKGLLIYDVSDPANATIVGECHDLNNNNIRDVKVKGDYAYVTDYGAGFAIIDVKDPRNPNLVSEWTESGCSAERLFVSGDYVYLADMSKGLTIINVSDKKHPSKVYDRNFNGLVYDVFVDSVKNLAYIASSDNEEGLVIMNVSNPENPTMINDSAFDGELYRIMGF